MTSPTHATAPLPPVPRRRRTILWAAFTVGLVVVAFGIALASQVNSDPTYAGGPTIGRPAPTFDLVTLDGEQVDNASLAGKAVIVNFWNTWCIPCREEHPALVEFYERHRDEPDFVMIGIVRDDTEEAVRTWVEEKNVEWMITMDPGARAALDFATTGQPETFAIDPNGVVVGKQLGEASVDDLEELLHRARGGG